MSGWWSISSASPATRFTNTIALRKVGKQKFFRIAWPSLFQPFRLRSQLLVDSLFGRLGTSSPGKEV
jgi:hypothetical protein